MDGTGRRRCADIVNAGSTTARLIAARRAILAGYRLANLLDRISRN